MIRRTFAILGVLALAACGTTGPGPNLPPTYAPPPPPPGGSIVGHGTFRTRNGLHGSCAGLSIALMRDTPGFRDRVSKLYGSTDHATLPIATVKARSARLGPSSESPLVGTAACDAARGFHFSGLTAGSYYLIGRIRLGAADKADEDYVVLKSVSLGEGETRDVSLAP